MPRLFPEPVGTPPARRHAQGACDLLVHILVLKVLWGEFLTLFPGSVLLSAAYSSIHSLQLYDNNIEPFWCIDCFAILASTLDSHTDIVKTVLLVDDNLGFAFWLGQALDRAGYETWPARSVPAAESLLEEVPLAVDLLVINASLPRAPAFATQLCRNRADFKVIAVCEGATDLAESFPQANAVHQKPQTIDIAAKLEWVQLVRVVLPVKD